MPETEVGLDGLLELSGVELLDELGSLKGGVERGAVIFSAAAL